MSGSAVLRRGGALLASAEPDSSPPYRGGALELHQSAPEPIRVVADAAGPHVGIISRTKFAPPAVAAASFLKMAALEGKGCSNATSRLVREPLCPRLSGEPANLVEPDLLPALCQYAALPSRCRGPRPGAWRTGRRRWFCRRDRGASDSRQGHRRGHSPPWPTCRSERSVGDRRRRRSGGPGSFDRGPEARAARARLGARPTSNRISRPRTASFVPHAGPKPRAW